MRSPEEQERAIERVRVERIKTIVNTAFTAAYSATYERSLSADMRADPSMRTTMDEIKRDISRVISQESVASTGTEMSRGIQASVIGGRRYHVEFTMDSTANARKFAAEFSRALRENGLTEGDLREISISSSRDKMTVDYTGSRDVAVSISDRESREPPR